MNLQELIDEINLNTDENFENNEVQTFINQAISKINVECQTKFPYVTAMQITNEEVYAGFEEDWQHALLVPYASGKIKQNDSSQFEFEAFYTMFDNNLSLFKAHYDVPTEYKLNEDGSVKFTNFNNNPYHWHIGREDGSDPLNNG